MNAVNANVPGVSNPLSSDETVEQLDFEASTVARIAQTVTLTAGTEYTFSVWARAASATAPFRLRYWDNVGGSGGGSAFTASATWSASTGRYEMTFTAANSGTFQMFIQNAGGTAVSRRIYFWGAMLNVGATALDYVKTEFPAGPSNPPTAPMEFGDNFAGVTAYYSLRRFTKGEDNNAIRVRRSSDDTEQDIGFDANGDLDTTALLAFVNSGKLWDTATDGNLTYVNRSSVENNQSVGGRTGVQKFTSTDTNAFFGQTNLFPTGDTNDYTIELDVYIPTGQDVNGVRTTQPFTSSAQTITQGEWTTITITGVNSSNVNFILNMLDDGSNAISAGQVVYVDTVTITQTTADGAVTTFYDQTGNGNDATNSTESEQPLVVSGGTLVEENSKAAVDFDGVDDYFTASNLLTELDNTDFLISAVSADEFSAGSEASVPRLYLRHRAWSYNTLDTMTWSPLTGQSLLSFQVDGATQEVFGNGTSLATASEAQVDFTPTDFQVGRYASTGWMDGKIQELIIYASDQSANRTGIEGNINDHFDIYT